MSPNFSDNTNMDTIDFKKLSEQLRSELLRVNGWRKVVRTGSIAVYLFVFCWFMFVLFGGALVSYIGLENYMQFTQYIIPSIHWIYSGQLRFHSLHGELSGTGVGGYAAHYVYPVSYRLFLGFLSGRQPDIERQQTLFRLFF